MNEGVATEPTSRPGRTAGGPESSSLSPTFGQPHGNIASRIGNTPLLRLRRVAAALPKGVELWAKAEFLNPGGSVKDRTALSIVESGIAEGKFGRGKVLLDASSGNTGIAYAFLGAMWGFPVEIVLPRNASVERLRRLQAYGARLTFSDRVEGTDGAQRLAKELAASHPSLYWYPDQYNHPANPLAHYRTTGPEIWRDSCGLVTHFVAGIGTGGTITGVGRFLKERSPHLQVAGVEPATALHGIEGLKHLATALRPGVFDERGVDTRLSVETEDAQVMTRRLAREEGLFVGTSSGAAVHAAIEYGRKLERGVVVTILPDGGDRYTREKYWEEGSEGRERGSVP
ncbi:MAG: cysteine synthase family protein [Euryarchaeota archaeon]|nr:cysteine synthase family protein [Euryarchaeota archaeon]MDE1881864.1 cysteine synthase family protein [Euryarchaeota archaeon]MDE2045459.1 cysteine synthase family protein [Thermoplasmata archaeon]